MRARMRTLNINRPRGGPNVGSFARRVICKGSEEFARDDVLARTNTRARHDRELLSNRVRGTSVMFG